DEISIVVANTKEYIYYRPSKRIDLKIKPGDVVKKNSIAYRALEAKQKVSEFNNRDVFGNPIKEWQFLFMTVENFWVALLLYIQRTRMGNQWSPFELLMVGDRSHSKTCNIWKLKTVKHMFMRMSFRAHTIIHYKSLNTFYDKMCRSCAIDIIS